MRKAEVFEVVLAVCGMLLMLVIVHELTHVALNTTATGICFGRCDIGEGMYSPAAIYYQEEATVNRDEFLPCLFGDGSFFFLLWLYASLAYKRKL